MASLFNALGNSGRNANVQNGMGSNGSPQGQMNIFDMYKNFRQMITGDPNDILRQKLQSGEVKPEVVERAKQILGMK